MGDRRMSATMVFSSLLFMSVVGTIAFAALFAFIKRSDHTQTTKTASTRTNDATVTPAEPPQQEEDGTIALVRIVSSEDHDLESPAAPLKPGVTSSLERMEVNIPIAPATPSTTVAAPSAPPNLSIYIAQATPPAPAPAPAPATATPSHGTTIKKPSTSTKLCRFYGSSRGCRNGEMCPYIHERSQQKEQQQQQQQPQQQQQQSTRSAVTVAPVDATRRPLFLMNRVVNTTKVAVGPHGVGFAAGRGRKLV